MVCQKHEGLLPDWCSSYGDCDERKVSLFNFTSFLFSAKNRDRESFHKTHTMAQHNTLHITVISSFHLLLWWTYQTFMLQLLPVLWQLQQTETEFITSHGSESYPKINSLLLVACTMLWCLVTEHSVSRLHSGTTKRGLSSDALCGELPPNIVTVRRRAERSA